MSLGIKHWRPRHDQRAGLHLQVGALVHGLDDAQVVLEVGDERVPLVGEVLRLLGDLPVEALQPLPGDSCRKSQRRVCNRTAGCSPAWNQAQAGCAA
jgi:hypothetical protein